MPLHAGFIGCGSITDTHARAVRDCPDLRVAAFHGANAVKAEALAEVHGGRSFADLDAFLAHRPMDFVIIGSPSGLHAAHGIAAAERGLHVLVEKPIETKLEKADALIHATKKARVCLAIIFQDRLKPGLVALRRAINEGVIGRVLFSSAQVKWYRAPEYYGSSRWRGTLALDGGGALINQGIHTVDLLGWLFGPVKRVKAMTATRLHGIEGEDLACAELEFEGGALATLEVTTCAFPGYPRRMEVTGTAGTVIVEGDSIVRADLRIPSATLVADSAPDAGPASSPVVADASAHRRVIEDFARHVRTGAPPACDGDDGRRTLAVVEAIYAAARAPAVDVC